jgi:hypothetical protein
VANASIFSASMSNGLAVELAQVGHRNPEPLGDGLHDVRVGQQLALHQNFPQRAGGRRGLLPDGRDGPIGQQRLNRVHQPFVGELHAIQALAVMRTAGTRGRNAERGR